MSMIATVAAAPLLLAGSMPEAGGEAPPLELAASDGRTYSLAKATGTTVLVFYRGLW
jgi:peroxiredoxin